MSTSGKKTWNHRKSTTKFFSALEIKNNNDNQKGAENLTQLVSSSIVESPGHILRYHRLPLNVLIQNTPDFPSLFSLKELNPIAWRLEISKQFWSFASNIIPTSGKSSCAIAGKNLKSFSNFSLCSSENEHCRVLRKSWHHRATYLWLKARAKQIFRLRRTPST